MSLPLCWPAIGWAERFIMSAASLLWQLVQVAISPAGESTGSSAVWIW